MIVDEIEALIHKMYELDRAGRPMKEIMDTYCYATHEFTKWVGTTQDIHIKPDIVKAVATLLAHAAHECL